MMTIEKGERRMTDLITRLEEATEGSRELDEEQTDEANSCPTCHDKTYVVDGVVVGECPACEKGGVR